MQSNSNSMASHSPNSSVMICIDIPPYVNSKGVWREYNEPEWWLNSSLPLVEFQLLLLGFSLMITRHFLKRFGVSKISSHILVGLVFGCSWNQLDKAKLKLFNVDSQELLVVLVHIGFTLYLFLSAAKIDPTMAIRTGRRSLIIGIPASLVSIIIGFLAMALLKESLTEKERIALPFLIVSYGSTSFPVVASLLNDLQILNSELGRLGLSSALVTDMSNLLILMAANRIRRINEDLSRGWAELGALILMLVVILFVFRPAMHWIIKQTPEGMPVKSSYIQVIIGFVLFSTLFSNISGIIMGPYILGLAVPDGAPLASTLVDKIEGLVSDVLMPILVVCCGLRVDLSLLSASFDDVFTKLNIALMCVAFTSHIVVGVLSSRYCKLSFKDSLALSLIITSTGFVQLVFYTLVRDRHLVDNGLYGCCILSVLFFATFVPVVVRFLYDPSRKYAGYQDRNIMRLNPASDELRLLACIHQNGNINAILHLLNLSCPTIENPLVVHTLHLMELAGRSTPIFISHKRQNNSLKSHSNSRHIINSFGQFATDNNGTVSVECYTAISSRKLMHDDVCTLALDKVVSLIILPFHRTWTAEGYIDKDDNSIRTLNYSVLERAPCSVGIFANRGNLGSIGTRAGLEISCTYSVCVIFLGGKDDREAISYAKRMASDSRVELTVLRLQESWEENRSNSNNLEDFIDDEVLRDFKARCLEDERVMFIENVCIDGPETALKLRKIVDMFDLIIVGRRNGLESPQTAGLSEWNEFPELGILGDLIVSTDIDNTRASLLVIQQQQVL